MVSLVGGDPDDVDGIDSVAVNTRTTYHAPCSASGEMVPSSLRGITSSPDEKRVIVSFFFGGGRGKGKEGEVEITRTTSLLSVAMHGNTPVQQLSTTK